MPQVNCITSSFAGTILTMTGGEAPFTIRNYRHSDLDEYARLRMEPERTGPRRFPGSAQAAIRSMQAQGAAPEQNIFVVEMGGKLEGYLELVPEHGISRVLLDCWIAPGHRRRGMAARLFQRALRRTGELGLKTIHVSADESNATARAVLSRLGFHPARLFLEMCVDIAGLDEHALREAAGACRRMQRGEEHKLAELQNLAFGGGWGYNPNSVEEVRRRNSLCISGADDVLFACEGDNIAGYCWTGSYFEETGENTGKIFMLGVNPKMRGRRVGKIALLAGMAHLKDKGARCVQLTVDSENKTALALYGSLGFRRCAASIMYEKEVS